MAAEQYFLKWNNHQSTLLSVFNSLLDSENLADCILSAEGESLKAHQVVISACSPYLEKLLNENRVNQFAHPILIFNDLKFEELKAMREYMYKGEVNVAQDNLNSFLKAAQSLQIKGLADQGGGGTDEGGGGGGKRKTDGGGDYGKRRRQRRSSREENCDSESSSCDTSSVMKANVTPRHRPPKEEKYEPQVKLEPPDMGPPPGQQAHMQLKTEPEAQDPEPVQDLTLDDDDYEDYDMSNMPGTSQPDLSQEMANWQMDGSMNSEDFAAAQQATMGNTSQNSTQDSTKLKLTKGSKLKNDINKRLKEIQKSTIRDLSQTKMPHSCKKKESEEKKVKNVESKLNHRKKESVDSDPSMQPIVLIQLLPTEKTSSKDVSKGKKLNGDVQKKKKLGKKKSENKKQTLKKPHLIGKSNESGNCSSNEIECRGAGNPTFESVDFSTPSSQSDPLALDVLPADEPQSLLADPLALDVLPADEPQSLLADPLALDVQPSDASQCLLADPLALHVQPADEPESLLADPLALDVQPSDVSQCLLADPLALHVQSANAPQNLSADPLAQHVQPAAASQNLLDDPLIIDISNGNCSDTDSEVIEVPLEDPLAISSKEVIQLSDGEDSGLLTIVEEEICDMCHKLYKGGHRCQRPSIQPHLLEQDPLRIEEPAEAAVSGRSKSWCSFEQCMVCEELFRRKPELLNHSIVCHGLTTPYEAIQCNRCKFTTDSIGLLCSHMNIHNKKDKFQCAYCIYKADSRSNFHTHIVHNHQKMLIKNVKFYLSGKGTHYLGKFRTKKAPKAQKKAKTTNKK